MFSEQIWKYECSESIVSVSSIDDKNNKWVHLELIQEAHYMGIIEFIRSFC